MLPLPLKGREATQTNSEGGVDFEAVTLVLETSGRPRSAGSQLPPHCCTSINEIPAVRTPLRTRINETHRLARALSNRRAAARRGARRRVEADGARYERSGACGVACSGSMAFFSDSDLIYESNSPLRPLRRALGDGSGIANQAVLPAGRPHREQLSGADTVEKAQQVESFHLPRITANNA